MNDVGNEIERKWLVDKIPDNLVWYESHECWQGYLSIDPRYEVRVSARGFLTVKKGQGLCRSEKISKINSDSVESLWHLTRGKRIHKIRHMFKIDDKIGELDIYQDENKGLIVVEVEFQQITEAKEFVPPDWFGLDVTDDPKYKNANLAK